MDWSTIVGASIAAVLGSGGMFATIFLAMQRRAENKVKKEREARERSQTLRAETVDEWQQIAKHYRTEINGIEERMKHESDDLRKGLEDCKGGHLKCEERCQELEGKVEGARLTNAIVVAWQGVGGEVLIKSINQAATRMFHWLPGQLENKPITVLIPERFHAAHIAAIRRVISTGRMNADGMVLRSSGGERLMGLRKNGTEIPVSIILSGFMDDGLWRFTAEIMEETNGV